MKITIDVPDYTTPEMIEKIQEEALRLGSPDWMCIWWHVEDVQEVCPDVSEKDARVVLQVLKRCHHAEVGVNWETIESVADNMGII
jgi:hypothetical protein